METDRARALGMVVTYSGLLGSQTRKSTGPLGFETSVRGRWSEPEHGSVIHRYAYVALPDGHTLLALEFCQALGRHINGSYADYLLTEEKYCLPLPEQLDFADGAIIAGAVGKLMFVC